MKILKPGKFSIKHNMDVSCCKCHAEFIASPDEYLVLFRDRGADGDDEFFDGDLCVARCPCCKHLTFKYWTAYGLYPSQECSECERFKDGRCKSYEVFDVCCPYNQKEVKSNEP